MQDGTAMVSRCFGPCALQMDRQVLSETVRLARAGLSMVTFLVMDGQARMSFFTVRIPVRNRNRLTLRSVGSGNMVLPVLS